MKNLRIYDENDYEMLQKMGEGSLAEQGTVEQDKPIEPDNYVVDFEETLIDLSDAGFVMINGRVVKR